MSSTQTSSTTWRRPVSDFRFEAVVKWVKEQLSDRVFKSHCDPTPSAFLAFLERQVVTIDCAEPSIERVTSLASSWDILFHSPTAKGLSTPLTVGASADIVAPLGHTMVLKYFEELAKAVGLQHVALITLS